uniref:SMC hinge domain-containing protein n=1 Tax=Gouania willdenowi TaxID=441366 RepID=A0A8C5GR14_GOUWI
MIFLKKIQANGFKSYAENIVINFDQPMIGIVDAKPEERKKIFEEAAGIGRYTKKKAESIRQLERSENNFNRLADIVKELERDLKKLGQQADKVKKFQEIKEELTSLELTILVKDINAANQELAQISSKLKESKDSNVTLTPLIKNLEDEKRSLNNLLESAELKIEDIRKKYENTNKEVNNLEIKKSIIENNVSKNRESTDVNVRKGALGQTITNLKTAITTKKNALSENQVDFEAIKKTQGELESKKNYLSQKYLSSNSDLATNRTQLNNLLHNAKSGFHLSQGVKGIMENKNALDGIHGTLADLIQVDEEYEKAVSTALGAATGNIIVNTHNNAARAIKFLKENKIGQATFLPIYGVDPKYIPDDILEILSQISGYEGICSEKVEYENKLFQSVIDYLLARTIIATDIDKAQQIFEYSKKNYRIVTKDGDLIMPGGATRGGYNKFSSTTLNVQSKIDDLKIKITELENVINQDQIEISNLIVHLTEVNTIVNEKSIIIAKLEEFIENSEKELIRYETEYGQLKTENESDADVNDSVKEYDLLLKEITILTTKLENESQVILSNEEIKKKIKQDIAQIETKIHDLRIQHGENTDILLRFEKREVHCQSIIDNAREKINTTYKMALEHAIASYSNELTMPEDEAREKVRKLNKSIEYLGNLNMDALNELKEKQTRYDFTSKELAEAREARDNILSIINDADSKARIDYEKTITNINQELPNIFQYLFGGGNCQVAFSDAQNLLESGIDILAEPPGKKVNSLVALSGGEKTLVALSVLFAILKTSHFPLVILDEAEAALDPANVERFGKIVSKFSHETQFIVITHRPGTMERCDSLYGATMIVKGVTKMYQVHLNEAKNKFSQEKK